MVHWSAEEKAAIASVWEKVDPEEDGHQTLTRLLLVYPWTQRYFSSFGNLSNVMAIAGNAKVRAHGKKVLSALEDAIKDVENLKSSLANLSETHSQKLNVDPENFKLLGDVLIIVLAAKLGATFSPEVHATWEKLLGVVAAALSRHYR